jgi:ABC-type multidrug transport system fused ATPase/permease subunit
MERVFDVLDRKLSVQDAEDAVELPCQPRTLNLEDVSFSYPDGRPVLQNVNVSIRPGEMVAFVGSSGVGKSTLLNLLPRFFDPSAGSVKFDGVNLKGVRLSSVRRHVALVLQENPILPTTIQENITYSFHRCSSGGQPLLSVKLASTVTTCFRWRGHDGMQLLLSCRDFRPPLHLF